MSKSLAVDRVIGVTTVDAAEADSDGFARLMRSSLGVVDTWYVVVRGPGGAGSIERIRALSPDEEWLTIVDVQPMGVSAARNRGLLRLQHLDPSESSTTVVIFPDPDAWFDGSSRQRIVASLASSEVDVAVGPYGPSDDLVDRQRWPQDGVPVWPSSALAYVASAGIVVRRCALTAIGYFDERLGVGTNLEAAEDVEYVMRAATLGLGLCYFVEPFLYHSYKPSMHKRMIGGCAVVAGYRRHLPSRTLARYLLRSFVDRSGPLPRPSPMIGLRAVHASRTYRSVTPATVGAKRDVEGLQMTEADPRTCLPEIVGAALAGNATTVVAAHITSLNAAKDAGFTSAFNDADFAFVDGISVSIAARLGGVRLTKLATTDYAVTLLQQFTSALGRPPRVAVVGGEPGVAEAAGNVLATRGLAEIRFVAHGYHEDSTELVRALKGQEAEVLIVGMGMPREAIWIADWKGSLDVPLILTCGGWLRLLAGLESRAPRLWQRMQIEWMWRLLTDPVRTARRYTHGVRNLVGAALRRT